MLGDTLSYVKQKLATQLGTGKSLPQFVFLAQQDDDAIRFSKDAITMLLINMEKEENTKPDNAYINKVGVGESAKYYNVFPEIRLNIYLMLVANWGDYITGLNRLSDVIAYFQANRVFADQADEGYPKNVEKLTVEFITLPLGQQNELWTALRTTYRPSALFKIRMLVFQANNKDAVTKIKSVENIVHQDLKHQQ